MDYITVTQSLWLYITQQYWFDFCGCITFIQSIRNAVRIGFDVYKTLASKRHPLEGHDWWKFTEKSLDWNDWLIKYGVGHVRKHFLKKPFTKWLYFLVVVVVSSVLKKYILTIKVFHRYFSRLESSYRPATYTLDMWKLQKILILILQMLHWITHEKIEYSF